MIRLLIYLANIIILCSTPFITPYLIPHYSLVIAILLILLYVGEKRTQIWLGEDLWTNTIIYCIVCIIIHGQLTFLFFVDEEGIMGIRNALGMSMKYVLVLLTISLIKCNYNLFHSVFWRIHIVIIVLAILLFVLCFIGIYPPYIEFAPDGREHYFFYIGSTNQMVEFGEKVFIRIGGFCDEPGRLALVLTYLLVLNEFTYKKNTIRILLCCAGFLTFSAAFFITLVPLCIYWNIQKIVNLRVIFSSLFIGIFASIIFVKSVDPEIQENINDAVDIFITNRFQKGSDGKFHGDNRSEALDLQFEAFARSPIVGVLGKGPAYELRQHLGVPTFVSGLARYGLFDLLLYMPFVLLYTNLRKTKYKWLMIAIGINFLQRPELEHMFFLVSLSLVYYRSLFAQSEMCTKGEVCVNKNDNIE